MNAIKELWHRISIWLMENAPLTDLWGEPTDADFGELARLDRQIEDLTDFRSLSGHFLTPEGLASIDREIASLRLQRDQMFTLVMGA